MKNIYVIGILCLLSVGCKGKKEIISRQQEATQISLSEKDSLRWQQLAFHFQHRQIDLKHWQLSPPDSSGMQYIQTITEIKENEDLYQTSRSMLQSESASRSSANIEKVKETHEKREIKRGYSSAILFVLLFLVIFGILYFRKSSV